jgi:hypothetical protein
MTESALTTTPVSSVYKNEGSFELHQRMAKSLAQSELSSNSLSRTKRIT